MKKLVLILLALPFAALAGNVSVTSVTAQQRDPWNGLVDITVTIWGAAEDVAGAELSFVAMNSATKTAIPVKHIAREGSDSGSRTIWTRKLVWNVKADIGTVRIDDVALSVDAGVLGGVQLWENGPYWAECNVGAAKPEEYGYYFWWGDAVEYEFEGGTWGAGGFYLDGTWVSSAGIRISSSMFSSYTCPWYKYQSPYFYVDDAATTHLGSLWRRPTAAEMRQLVDACTTVWTTRNGVYGRLVTGKGAYSSKSIFLPAAGYGSGNSLWHPGSSGEYWTSEFDSRVYAWALVFDSDEFILGRYQVYCGMPVRPLRNNASVLITHFALDPPVCIVTFNANGGFCATSSEQYFSGLTFGTLPAVTRKGYKFLGWFTAASGGAQVTKDSVVDTSLTLYAHWAEVWYAISFNANGGTPTPSAVSLQNEFAYGALPTVTRKGYKFLGWFTAASGGTQVTKDSIVDSARTLYAHWAEVRYAISFDANGGTPMPSTLSLQNELAYGTLPVVTRKGYKFLGWFTAVSGGTRVTSDSIVDAARTLYAHWEEYWCVVRFDPQDGVSAITEKTLRGDSAYGVLPVLTRSGFKFLGWFTAANGGAQITEESVVDSDRSLYAHWQKIMHTIYFDTNKGVLVTNGSYQEAFPYGELPQATRDGFVFLGWFTEPAGGERVTADTIVDSSRTLYAHWDRYAYDFKWLGGGGLDICSRTRRTDEVQGIAMDSAWVNGGARAVVSVDGVEKAESKGADEFVWRGNETKEYTLKHQVYDAQGRAVGEPYTAKIAWTSRAAVTFDGGNGEEAFSREYDESYAYGELPSVTKTGHAFAGWYTAAEGGEKVEVGAQFDGSVSKLYAHWTVNQYGVKFDKNGGEGTAGDLTVAYGDVVPMDGVAFRKSGYRLAGWATAADGAAVYGQGGAMSNLTAEANGSVQLYAVWEPTTVDLKSFKQRYPWNGFVDVECEVGAEGRVGLMLIDEDSGTNFTAKTLFCQGGSVTNSALWMVEGPQKFIWDAGSDLPDGFKTSKLKAKTYFVEGEE